MAKYTENQLEGMKIARHNERFLAKMSRRARLNNDHEAFLAAQNAGYMYRGIENVDDKNLRYFQKASQRRFYGDAGAGVGAGDTQRPAEDTKFPIGSGSEIGTGASFKANTSSVAPAQGRISSPTPPLVTSSGAGAAPTVAQPMPNKPKSFFEERASGRQDFVNTIRNQRNGEEGVTDKFAEQARERGAALGLTPEQIQATLDGETELSPEKIAERAKERRDKKISVRNEEEQGMRDSIAGANMSEVNNIIDKSKSDGAEMIRSGKERDKAMLDRVAETRKMLSDMTKATENRDQAYLEARKDSVNNKEKRLSKAEQAYAVQQRLQSDYQEKVLTAEEWKQREQDKNEIAQTFNFMVGKKAPEVGEAPGAMDYKNFDPKKYPKAYSKEEQARINEEQDRRMAKVRGVEYEPRADINLMSRNQFLKNAGQTVKESERVLKQNAEDKIRTDKGYVFGESLSKDMSEVWRGLDLDGFSKQLGEAYDSVGKMQDQAKIDRASQRDLKWNDSWTKAGNYIMSGNTPTNADINKFAKDQGIPKEKAGEILKKKAAEARGVVSPTAQIDIGKIQGAYEKASRGADDILFGLSFDQRKV